MKFIYFLIAATATVLFLTPSISRAQCGMGVPSAGNPNCIPPSVQGSPYGTNQGSYSQQPVRQQPIVVRHKWADRWGAMVLDQKVIASGMSVGAATKTEAIQYAQAECKKAGGVICGDVYTYKNSCGAVIVKVGGGMYIQTTIHNS